ncbi:hypothetical protein QBZ16_003171 [Prototheca wickerhamii]|uniref:CRC domain-containing protein n=1 Tax=Prototheca wickerhamii TaxID=3111 RepID=A0AAD9ILR8_PROWI|nr:hypothetical protein QBZ16_003171 [Prototheca wickerhamii]
MQGLARTPGAAPHQRRHAPGGAVFFAPGQPQLNAAAAAALASPARRQGGRARQALPAASSKRHCNCKNSRCLKLYCECFASGRYCDGCNCVGCCNNQSNEGTRQAAVEAILDRNPNAFRPKIAGDVGEEGGALGAARHNKGCNCKKSGCLKKYCECFQAGIFCSANCKCVDCKNYEGSEARAAAISPGMPAHLSGSLAGEAAARDAGAAAHASPRGAPARRAPAARAPGGAPQAQAGLFGLPSSPPEAYRAHFGGVVPVPGPSPQGVGVAVTRAQRAAALREALKEAVKPEVVEKVCQLLLISAGEAQTARDGADGTRRQRGARRGRGRG